MMWSYLAENLTRIARLPSARTLAVAGAAIVLGTSAASAQVIVVQSTAPGLNAGSVLENNTRITIPKDAKAIFVLPNGATRTITGPFSGRAANLTKGVRANPGVFDAVRRYVRTGGSTQRHVGAVRSAAPAFALGKPLPFSWTAVPLTVSGDYCIKKGAPVTLVRSRGTQKLPVTIIDMGTKRKVRVAFKAGADSVAWPRDLGLQAGATYALLTAGRPARQMRLRIITPVPAWEDTLQVLHGQRCQSQFRAFIRDMQQASR